MEPPAREPEASQDAMLHAQEVMQRNTSRLTEALDHAEQALQRAQQQDQQHSVRTSPHPKRSTRKAQDTNASSSSLRAGVLKRHAHKVAQALVLYERRVDATTETIVESFFSQDPNLIHRAQSFLHQWRHCLEVDDHIHCPDYDDEYECGDETRGWIKQFPAIVKEVAEPGSTVPVGDSSAAMDQRELRPLQETEKAIFVHFVGFPKTDDRWILLSAQDPLSLHVMPRDAHLATIAALEKLHPKTDASVEEQEDVDREANILEAEEPEAHPGNQLGKAEKEGSNMQAAEPINGSPPKCNKRKRVPLINGIKTAPTSGTTQPPVNISTVKPRNRKRKPSPKSKDDKEKDTNQVEPSQPKTQKRESSQKPTADREQVANLVEPSQSNTPVVQKNAPTKHSLHRGRSKRTRTSLESSTANKEEGTKEPEPVKSDITPKVEHDAAGKPTPEPEKKKKKRSAKETRLDMTWICTECKEAECISDRDSPLLICEGQCNRPFHVPCAGLATIPPSDQEWICGDCLKGQHQCAVCHQFGTDNEDVFCCSKDGCGMFYHESCLSMYNVEVEVVEVQVEQPNNGTASVMKSTELEQENLNTVSVSKPRFTCPAHACWTCTEDIFPPSEDAEEVGGSKKSGKGRRKKKSSLSNAFQSKCGSNLIRCLECPIAYHVSCIPPIAKFHELALLCHEHASTCKLPELDLESSFQGKVEANADRKLEKMLNVKKRKADLVAKKASRLDEVGTNIFFPGMRGDMIVEEEESLYSKLQWEQSSRASKRELHFCLPCDFKQQVHSKPPSYRHVHSLRCDPSNRPKRRPPTGEACRCKSLCDDDCLNRMVMMECIGDSSKANGEKNSYWNCNLGPKCGNRALGQRKFAKCRPQREQGKGWGLISVNGVKTGELVQEYVGEVIDEQTKEERLIAWARDHPNDPNYYVMQLDTGWYIDAREEANMSRFINHSCDPNCHLVRVNVGGHMRVAIFCIRDVAPGDFLSYDYQFDTKHGEKFVCRCGAAKCRGTMKGGKSSSAEEGMEKKSKKQVLQEAKASFDRDKKFLEDVQKNEAERLWQVGVMVPAATSIGGSETVASGPQERYRDVAQRNRLFLWRNVIRGANFAARYTALQNPSRRECSSVPPSENGAVDVLSVL